MMEFLINIKIEWPEGMDPELKERISVHEREVAAELAKKGHLIRMWRTPGRRENWGLWQAKDATQMHEIISSLPVWPWMNVTVHALARHAVDPNPVMPETEPLTLKSSNHR
jgi:muconolactone D-isomerase